MTYGLVRRLWLRAREGAKFSRLDDGRYVRKDYRRRDGGLRK